MGGTQGKDQNGDDFSAMCCRASSRQRDTLFDDFARRRGPQDGIHNLGEVSEDGYAWGCMDAQSTTTADPCEWGCMERADADSQADRVVSDQTKSPGRPESLDRRIAVGKKEHSMSRTQSLDRQIAAGKQEPEIPSFTIPKRTASAGRRGVTQPKVARKEFEQAEKFYTAQHKQTSDFWKKHHQKEVFDQMVTAVSAEERQLSKAMTVQRSNRHYLKTECVVKDSMANPAAWSDRVFNKKTPTAGDAEFMVGQTRNMGSSKTWDLKFQRDHQVTENGVATISSNMSHRELLQKAKMTVMRENAARRERELQEQENQVFHRAGSEAKQSRTASNPISPRADGDK